MNNTIEQNVSVQIIGVIDLKEGKAVHARGGRRDSYAPIRHSAGTAVNGDPLTLARLYVDAFGLTDIYLADLDAIAGRPLQTETICGLGALGASLWVDAGVSQTADGDSLLEAGAHRLVVGLETLASFEDLEDICAQSAQPVAFSLDLRDGTPMSRTVAAPAEAIARRAVDAGAHVVIVLDVARVGSAGGPDFDLLRRIRSRVPGVELFAGGGVRGRDDLESLSRIGCTGALVASALHDGRLSPADVAGVRGHIARDPE